MPPFGGGLRKTSLRNRQWTLLHRFLDRDWQRLGRRLIPRLSSLAPEALEDLRGAARLVHRHDGHVEHARSGDLGPSHLASQTTIAAFSCRLKPSVKAFTSRKLITGLHNASYEREVLSSDLPLTLSWRERFDARAMERMHSSSLLGVQKANSSLMYVPSAAEHGSTREKSRKSPAIERLNI